MTINWYPEKLLVGPNGTPSTYKFIEENYHPEQHFAYAEFGIYKAETAKNICEKFTNCRLYLFDFHENISTAKSKLSKFDNLFNT